MGTRSPYCLAALALALSVGCTAGSEAPLATLTVNTVALEGPLAVTDLGVEVELTGARLMVADVLLKTSDEDVTVASLVRSAGHWLIPAAHAHPGHGEGGAVIGELLGRSVVDLAGGGSELGTAQAVLADLDHVDFLLTAATTDDVDDGDPLLGHAGILTGTATQDGRTLLFEVQVGLDEDTPVLGAPVSPALSLIEGDNGALGLALRVTDPIEGDTLFDGVDFAAAADAARVEGDEAEPLVLLPGSPDHNRVQRKLVSHDHYTMLSAEAL